MKRLSFLFAGVAMAGLVATAAQGEITRQADSEHTATHAGLTYSYRAVVADNEVRAADGTAATIVTTSYLRNDVETAQRPVLFIFNGGPGASTTPLHFGAFGPMRRFGEGQDQYLLPNPRSLLDAVDLVFIDPVGTGYSRPEGDGRGFWSRTGDARSVADAIAGWLSAHGREASPRYLLGQSYGTVRAAEIARLAPELDFDGILLFALVPGERSGPLAAMSALPSYAAAACHHRVTDCAGRTPQQVYEGVVDFARTDYVSILIRGGSVSPSEKQAMADRLSALTGLDTGLLLEADLKIDNRLFMFNLMKDRGLRTGQLDARATASLDAPSRQPPHDDPGLGYAPETGVRALQDGDDALRAREGLNVVDTYYADHLGYVSTDPYNALNLQVNAAWDHEGFRDAMPYLAEAMKKDEGLRLFWSAGLYDLSTPAYGGRYTLDQAGIPADRLTAAYFASGHSVFVDESNLETLARAVRAFIQP